MRVYTVAKALRGHPSKQARWWLRIRNCRHSTQRRTSKFTASKHPETDASITIDGELKEEFWKDAAQLGPFILYHGKKEAKQQTRVKAAWSPDYLYLAFECDDTDVHTPYSKRDDPIYDSEAAEIFIDADGDQDDYIELQNAPNNVI